MVEVTVQLPDDVARQLALAGNDIPRCILEAVALDGYLTGKLARGQVRELLGLSWQATEEFLARRGACRQYGLDDLELDRHTLQTILPS